MINTDSKNGSRDEQPQKRPPCGGDKRPVGKPRTAIWRYQREDGKYNNNPISPAYFRDYYREKLSMKTECKFCKGEICIQQIKRHQNTAKCLKLRIRIFKNFQKLI